LRSTKYELRCLTERIEQNSDNLEPDDLPTGPSAESGSIYSQPERRVGQNLFHFICVQVRHGDRSLNGSVPSWETRMLKDLTAVLEFA
jgi:hypothetical protein